MSTPDPLERYYHDPKGLELVQAILDRKKSHDFGAWLERRKLPRVIGPEDWPTEAELRDDLTRRKTGRNDA